jgi:hypothetical protein
VPEREADASSPLQQDERVSLSHCGAVALFAMDMLQEIARIREQSTLSVELRIGLHSGKVVGGIIGKSRPRYFIWGNDTVIANLMESSGVAGQIQASDTTANKLRREGFLLERYQVVSTDQGHGHAPAPAPAPAPAAAAPAAGTAPTHSGAAGAASSDPSAPVPSGGGGHGGGAAGRMLQTYLLRAYVAPDETIISVPEPPRRGQ